MGSSHSNPPAERMSDDDDDDVDDGLWVVMCIGRIGEVRDGMGVKDWIIGGVNRRRDDKARRSHGENRQFMVMVTWLVVGGWWLGCLHGWI